jgi:hypothetical protein
LLPPPICISWPHSTNSTAASGQRGGPEGDYTRPGSPGGAGPPSQQDLFVLARSRHGLVAITVEGEVSETFGRYVSDWRSSVMGSRLRSAISAPRLDSAHLKSSGSGTNCSIERPPC